MDVLNDADPRNSMCCRTFYVFPLFPCRCVLVVVSVIDGSHLKLIVLISQALVLNHLKQCLNERMSFAAMSQAQTFWARPEAREVRRRKLLSAIRPESSNFAKLIRRVEISKSPEAQIERNSSARVSSGRSTTLPFTLSDRLTRSTMDVLPRRLRTEIVANLGKHKAATGRQKNRPSCCPCEARQTNQLFLHLSTRHLGPSKSLFSTVVTTVLPGVTKVFPTLHLTTSYRQASCRHCDCAVLRNHGRAVPTP